MSFCEAVPSVAHDSLMVNEFLGFLGTPWSQEAQEIGVTVALLDPTSWWIILVSENGLPSGKLT